MQVTNIQQGVVSAKGGTVIGRMDGEEMAFSVITLTDFQTQVSRYFVTVYGIVFELVLNGSYEITEVQTAAGRISMFTANTLRINSHEIGINGIGYFALITVDESTEEETITQFTIATGGKKATGYSSDIIVLNYGISDLTLFYNKGVNDITFDANSEVYSILSI